ncbi:hypothetical protein PO909_033757, partial [Leuciscus waleckii]
TSVKEGLLLKQTSSFQRWKKRYFKLRGRTLYYAKDAKAGGVLARWQYRVSRSRVCWRVLSVCWTGARGPPPTLGPSGSEEGLVAIRSLIFDEVDLSDASVAESSTKNVNNSFTVRGDTYLY